MQTQVLSPGMQNCGHAIEVFAKQFLDDNKNKESLLEEIKNGTRGYLFDSEGKFYNMSK